jgi:hypothetical protein
MLSGNGVPVSDVLAPCSHVRASETWPTGATWWLVASGPSEAWGGLDGAAELGPRRRPAVPRPRLAAVASSPALAERASGLVQTKWGHGRMDGR